MNGSKKVVDSPCMSLELCNDGGGVTRWSIGDSDATAQLKMAEPLNWLMTKTSLTWLTS